MYQSFRYRALYAITLRSSQGCASQSFTPARPRSLTFSGAIECLKELDAACAWACGGQTCACTYHACACACHVNFSCPFVFMFMSTCNQEHAHAHVHAQCSLVPALAPHRSARAARGMSRTRREAGGRRGGGRPARVLEGDGSGRSGMLWGIR